MSTTVPPPATATTTTTSNITHRGSLFLVFPPPLPLHPPPPAPPMPLSTQQQQQQQQLVEDVGTTTTTAAAAANDDDDDFGEQQQSADSCHSDHDYRQQQQQPSSAAAAAAETSSSACERAATTAMTTITTTAASPATTSPATTTTTTTTTTSTAAGTDDDNSISDSGASAATAAVVIGDEEMVGHEEGKETIWRSYARKCNMKMYSIQEASTSALRVFLDVGKKDSNVKLVVVCFSGNVCVRGTISEYEWKSLIEMLNETFPEARILMGSVIFPLYGGKLKYRIIESNDNLRKAVREARQAKRAVRFVDLRSVTRKRSSRKLKSHMYRNALFPNTECVRRLGAALFMKYQLSSAYHHTASS